MDKIILVLSKDITLEIQQMDTRWYRYNLKTKSEDIPIGGEWLSIFWEKLEKFLEEFNTHEIQKIKGIIAFAEPHSVICSQKISATETLLQFRDKENLILWEEKIDIEVIKNWLTQEKVFALE